MHQVMTIGTHFKIVIKYKIACKMDIYIEKLI